MKKNLGKLVFITLVICALSSCTTPTGFKLTQENKGCKSIRYKDGYNENKGDLKTAVYCGDGDAYSFLCKYLGNIENKEHLTGQRFNDFKENTLETAKAKRTGGDKSFNL